MRRFIVVPVVIAAAFLSVAAAPGPRGPETRTLCLEGGRTRPPVCSVPASRTAGAADFCYCSAGRRIKAPLCGPAERPIGETREFEQARKIAAEDGSLVGDLFNGRPMCVAPSAR